MLMLILSAICAAMVGIGIWLMLKPGYYVLGVIFDIVGAVGAQVLLVLGAL